MAVEALHFMLGYMDAVNKFGIVKLLYMPQFSMAGGAAVLSHRTGTNLHRSVAAVACHFLLNDPSVIEGDVGVSRSANGGIVATRAPR